MQQSLYKTGRLQARLQRLGLQCSKPFHVHPSLYQSCLCYTIVARLAPSWNKVGEWYIQGRDFTSHHGRTKAIKMNVCVNKNEIFSSLCGALVRFPPLQIEDMNLSRQEMLEVVKSTQEDGQQVELQNSWCHVLPSMKEGKISSVSLLIPPGCPFSSYTELKRYWKNMYGYRLPETDQDIFYCQVSFLPSGSRKKFTYPDVCLRNQPIHLVNRFNTDPKAILAAFLQDFHSRVGSVCGHLLQFVPKMHHATLSLHGANEGILPQDRPSLVSEISKPIKTNHEPNHRQQHVEEKIQNSSIDKRNHHCASQNQQLPSQNQQLHSNLERERDCSSIDTTKNQIHTMSNKEGFTVDGEQSVLKNNNNNNNNALPTLKNKLATGTNSITATPSLPSNPKFTPSFHPKHKLNNDTQETNTESRVNTPRFVPMFRAKSCSSSSSTVKKNINNSLSHMNAKSKIQATGTSQQKNDPSLLTPVFEKKTKGFGIPKSCSMPASQQNTVSSPLISNSNNPSCTGPVVSKVKSLFCSSDDSCNLNFPSAPAQPSKMVPLFRGQCPQTPSLTSSNLNIKTKLPSSFTQEKKVLTPKHSNNMSNTEKRSAKSTESEAGTPKKPRTKIQDLDVEALARANQLSKVNTATLTAWLKERGLSGLSKDKKGNLMDKVNTHLNISLPEP